jgi:energy-coupling factor transporter ATP-binding protein EcfA2
MKLGNLFPEIDNINRTLATLSGGQRQRVSIAMNHLTALLSSLVGVVTHNNKVYSNSSMQILLLDEPYIGLDRKNRDIFFDVLFNKIEVTIAMNDLFRIRNLNNSLYILREENNDIIDDADDFEIWNTDENDEVIFDYEKTIRLSFMIITHLPREIVDNGLDKLFIMNPAKKSFDVVENVSDYLK